jgi:hypothetical protein
MEPIQRLLTLIEGSGTPEIEPFNTNNICWMKEKPVSLQSFLNQGWARVST